MVTVTSSKNFQYIPPGSAQTAKKILLKPNVGYPVEHPVTVDIDVLSTVIGALREANSSAEIFLVEGVCSTLSLDEIADMTGVNALLGDHVHLLDAETLPLKEYRNISSSPAAFKSLWAPCLIDEADCCISLAVLKRTESFAPLISASLKNLYGLFPRSKYSRNKPHARDALHFPSVVEVLQDIYFTIGHLFDGAVVGGRKRFVSSDWRPYEGKSVEYGKIVCGDDLLAVDREACQVVNEAVPSYIENIEALQGGELLLPGAALGRTYD